MLAYKKMHRSQWRYCVMMTVSMIVLYVIYIIVLKDSPKLNIQNGVVLEKYEPFEPLANADLGDGEVPSESIPKIIHWVHPTEDVERMYVDNLKSFRRFNPEWTFYLWTYRTTRRLIKDTLPELLQLWDDHSEYGHIEKRRLFLAKYIVLYVYGGVIIDLHGKNYRSLDTAISKYSCVLPPNPYEEAIITGVPYTVTNRIMMCRKEHPFLKLIVENLHRYQHMSTTYDAVGDGFLMTHYQLYNNLQRERDDRNIYVPQSREDPKDTTPFFYQGDLSKTHPDAVYVPNSVYFTGASDPLFHSTYIQTCSKMLEAPYLHQRACVHLYWYGMIRTPGKYTYIDLHNSFKGLLGNLPKDIKTVIPDIHLYGDKDV